MVTPVDVEELEKLLQDSNYDPEKSQRLVEGFRSGFTLGYEGRQDVKITSPNLKFSIGDEIELWNKVMTEVKELRYAGPFEKILFEEGYIQSPIRLVPKDNGTSTRLIFHLSYPRTGDSVNSGIPFNKCTVKYPDFDEAVKLCLQEGKGCYMGKSDMSSAFRHVPMAGSQWWLLVMKAIHPTSGEMKYFVDKCMPYVCLSAVLYFRLFQMQ